MLMKQSILLASTAIIAASALTIEEQFCGAGATSATCPVQPYNFFSQQSIDLLSLVSPVNSPIYGAYPVVVGEDDVPKNNIILFSTNNAAIDCTTSRAILFESGGDATALSNIMLSQNGPSSCLANFSMQITTTDLQKTLHLALAISDDIKSATPALGVQFMAPIVAGSLPLHVWTSIKDPYSATGAITQLNIKINANPMINETCLSQAAANNGEFHFQFVKPNDVIDPACKFPTENIVINTNDDTVFMEKLLAQTEYWGCANEVSYANNVMTFLIKVLPDFDGCTYYNHYTYSPYLYNIFIQYVFVQGPYGMVVETVTTVQDV